MEKVAYRLAAVGDVMLDRTVGKRFRERPQDFQLPEISTLLRGHDLIFANLENPVGLKGTPHPIQHPNVTFCCHPDTLKVLKNIGVTVVSLGNNHMLDYGETSLHETLEYLDSHGIKHVGAGRNYEEANRPLLLEVNDKKVAMLSYVFLYSASTKMATRRNAGVSEHRIGNILPRIKELARQDYQVLVSVHWGMEYCFYPLPYQMQQARQMIDHGACLIIGHGPHYPQGIEEYKDGRIVYSLGNFIFDEPHRFANRSFIYSVGVTGSNELCGQTIHPVHIVSGVPTLVDGRHKQSIERLVEKLGRLYPRRRKPFWQALNSTYFSDIVWRVQSMKSLKFAFLPPMSFYWNVGFKNYLRKFTPKRLRAYVGVA